MLGNWRAMQPLAVMGTRTERAAALGPNHRRFRSPWLPPAANERPPASQALAENDAKDSRGDSYAIPWGILKPNIYYKAHNFAPEPLGSELSRHETRQLLSPRDGERRRRTRQSRSQRPAGPDGDVAPAGTGRPSRLFVE